MIPVMDLYFGIAVFVMAVMAVVVSESGDGRIVFTVLAASGFFYGGFALLGSVFNASMTTVYVLAGICILGTVAYTVMNASAIIKNASPVAIATTEDKHVINLHK